MYFEKPYYLEPDKNSGHPYALLSETLKRSGRMGIGKYVLRNREHLVGLKQKEGLLILEQFRFKSEIKDFSQLNTPKGESIDDREVEIALNLVSQLSKPFKPDNYRDTYNDELKRVIQEKVEGKIPSVHGTAPIPTPVPDLMEMLKKSLEAEKTKREKTR
jgi:DNA end-binding protein Ku